jgi:hypothetical protein
MTEDFPKIAQHSEKYPKSPLKKPALKVTLRGFAVYFCVDRCRRKPAIGDKVSAGLFFMFVFKIKFQSPKRFFLNTNCLQMF